MTSEIKYIRPGLKIVAKLDGKELGDEYTPLAVDRALGGGVGDRATLRVNRRRHFVDGVLWPPTGELTIDVVDESGEGKEGDKERIFWGTGSGATLRLDEEGHVQEFRVARFHFGEPIIGIYEKWKLTKKDVDGDPAAEGKADAKKGVKEKKAEGEEIALLMVPPIFNPIIDGAVRGNMRPEDESGPGKCSLWVDWESMRSSKGRELQKIKYYGEGAFERNAAEFLWTVPKALHTLCWTLNGKERWIKNPTLAEIEKVVDKDKGLLRHRQLSLGMFLNEALDALLAPLGYTWSLDLDADEKKPTIQFHKRGTGEEKTLFLQKPSDKLSASRNNVGGGGISVGSHATTNQIGVMGGHKQHEVTIELVPAWRDDFDDFDDDQTAKDGGNADLTPGSTEEGLENYLTRAHYRRVHRDFVANEAGDYNGLRTRIKKALDLTGIFGHDVVPRRRRAFPCLTKLSDGQPIGDNGYLIEWKMRADSQWKTLDELWDHGEVQILENEIGIRFDGLLVPPDVQDNPDGIQFRLTCTIVDDDRLTALVGPSKKSAQTEAVPTVLDEADRFHYRKVHKSSIHYDKVKSGDLIADEVDDTEAIKKYAERQAEAWDMLDVDGSFVVIALDAEQYHLGEVVTSIVGRDIRLNATPGSITKRHPQIVSIAYDLVNHARQIGLSTMQNEARQ